MIFGPLFKTGFLIEAMFNREDWYGADSVIMTSASSKTSMALASVARVKSPQIKRIGLTSAGNVAFVEGTGLYDRVIAYGDIASLPQTPSVSVDFAGNPKLLRALHETLGGNLKYSCTVGITHVGELGRGDDAPMPGPTPTLFFAPDHVGTLLSELGPKAFGEAIAGSWRIFLGEAGGIVRVDERGGLQAAVDAFAATLKGTADPAVGIVVRP
jgi:hypothetical protein